ncbi:uncharacterized protein LOC143037506 isoform X2 [Oratosquilla oratoria]|uniref:uncharacterized protein LOC143037506 isoform X2 n=1 Tax=Oratosquilla oratoria TaxID=337810 RepID=UPI003F7697F4
MIVLLSVYLVNKLLSKDDGKKSRGAPSKHPRGSPVLPQLPVRREPSLLRDGRQRNHRQMRSKLTRSRVLLHEALTEGTQDRQPDSLCHRRSQLQKGC